MASIARFISTAGALLLAIGGFFGTTPADPLNPFGLLFLVLSGVVWLGWEGIWNAYSYAEESRERSDPILLRMAPFLVIKAGRRKSV
ncbi:MAG TPA: hypothetical protein VET89_02470 [Stellaceae bacterium]|nr:hypothetical protein [Stellaceae bacterium]